MVDEIVIYSSNTDEMVQEIRDRYGTTQIVFNEENYLIEPYLFNKAQ